MLREAAAEGTSAVVSCSYLQIYNDKLYDLLADRCARARLCVAYECLNVSVVLCCVYLFYCFTASHYSGNKVHPYIHTYTF